MVPTFVCSGRAKKSADDIKLGLLRDSNNISKCYSQDRTNCNAVVDVVNKGRWVQNQRRRLGAQKFMHADRWCRCGVNERYEKSWLDGCSTICRCNSVVPMKRALLSHFQVVLPSSAPWHAQETPRGPQQQQQRHGRHQEQRCVVPREEPHWGRCTCSNTHRLKNIWREFTNSNLIGSTTERARQIQSRSSRTPKDFKRERVPTTQGAPMTGWADERSVLASWFV
jgi:hypothetical protein